MNEKTARQIAEMKNQTIGVEVEMNSITRQKAAKVAAAYFGTGRYENTAGRNGYSTWSAWDAQGREWKFQKDVSIAGPDEQKCELVTPILTYGGHRNPAGALQTAQTRRSQERRLQRMRSPHPHRSAGAYTAEPSEPRQHHGEPREPDRRSAEAGSGSHEPLLPNGRPKVLRAGQPQEATTMAQLADIWYNSNGANYGRNHHYNDSRYHMLNLHATFTKGTVEFRLFQFDEPTAERRGGIHAGQLKSYIQLCLALSQMAKDVRTASPKPQQNENPKYAMRTWLLRLGLHRRGVRNGQGFPDPQPDRGHSLPAR